MRRCQRGVAAQIDFNRWREPSQRPFAAFSSNEGGLGQVHLRRERLHPLRVGFAAVEQADGGGISAERGVGEGVNVEKEHLV
jgi:hypothetical protein